MGKCQIRIPCVQKKIALALSTANQNASGLLFKNNLKRRWQFASPTTNRETYYSVKNFFGFLKNRSAPLGKWDLGSVLIFSEHRRNNLLEEYDLRVAKQKLLRRKKEIKPVSKSHLNSYVTSFRKFLRTAGINFLDDSDSKSLDVEEKS